MKINKLCFFTSAIIATMIAPAFADIANDAESATCDSTTIGVDEGSTVLEAQWTAQQIQCAAGTYLESDTAQCTACPAGSYCEGDTYTFNGTDLGITGACESGYTTDGSAAAQSDCYRACTTSDIAHSTAVSGKYYYGDNNQCAPTSCAAGYTPKAGLNLTFTTKIYGSINKNGVYGTQDAQTAHNQDYYGLTENNTWAVEADDGSLLYGRSSCNTTVGNSGYNGWQYAEESEKPDGTFTSDSVGPRCWCQLTGYKNNSDSTLENLQHSSWVYLYYGDPFEGSCAAGCAYYCSYLTSTQTTFRNTLLNSVAPIHVSCEANTIGITWKPQNGEANTVNQCTYDGAVTIPATPSKVGYDFAGWHVNNAK